MIKKRWSFSCISSLIHFAFFFSFLQEAISETRIFLQDLEELSPGGNDINMLVATHELESFAIKYGKTHLTANESAVIVQKLFGEFYALFDESGFFFCKEIPGGKNFYTEEKYFSWIIMLGKNLTSSSC